MPRRIRIGHVRAIRMSGDMGGYAYTGQAAAVSRTGYMAAVQGSYSLSGQDASLSATTGGGVSTSAGLVQYITHDGDAIGNSTRSSAPNGTFWNTVLEQAWSTTNGAWLDSAQTSQGSVPYASTGSVTAAPQRLSATVTTLVQRWISTGLNRGVFLRQRSNAFPLVFAGRTAATDADRPKLTVVTGSGTYTITARCNASWANQQTVTSRAAAFDTSSSFNAVLQFDLSTIVGAVTSATLAFTVTSLTQTGAVLDIYEANPPTLIDPASLVPATLGIGSLGNFATLASHASVLTSSDFATGKPTVKETFSTDPLDYIEHEASRTLDSARGTTYLRAYIASGQLSGVNIKMPIVTAASAGGVTQVAQRRSSAYGHCRFHMESTFAGLNDRVKIPAMGAQLGYWVATDQGYWQPVTGNGGSPGSGLKVIGAGGRVEYHGHSSRLTTGYRCADVSAYSDYVRLAAYIYHNDQIGGFPTEDVLPGIVLKRGVDYDFDHFIQLNTMTGAQDGLGNYATANADGIYRLWVNGYQALNRTNYRWRRHDEFAVQGFWVDVYHGGTNPSDRDMYFRINEVAVATQYIGPVGLAIQISGSTWTPNVDGSNNVLATDFTQLPLNTTLYVSTNKLDDVIPMPRLATKLGNSDGSPSIVRAWCGAAIDTTNERMYMMGGGHADSHICENGIYKLDATTLRFTMVGERSVAAAGQWWNGSAFVALTGASDTQNESSGVPMSDGRPPASHTFWMLDYLTPAVMGNTNGGVLHHYGPKHILNLDTGAYATPWWNSPSDNLDFSYGYVMVDGAKAFQPNSDFQMRVWDYSLTASTLWNTVNGGTSKGAIVLPTTHTTSGGFFHGGRIIRNTKAILRIPQRREEVILGVQSEVAALPFHRRLRLGQASDATASYSAGTSWASYFDTLALTSGDGSHADFNVQANFADIGFPSTPSHLFAAGCVWDNSDGRAWVWGNTTASDLYQLDGLATGNTVTTTRKPSTARPLTTSFNGTFGRVMLITRGTVKCLVRVNSTTEFAQIVRVA